LAIIRAGWKSAGKAKGDGAIYGGRDRKGWEGRGGTENRALARKGEKVYANKKKREREKERKRERAG